MRHRRPSLKQLCVTAACAAVLLPAVATAASYQHRVNLQGLVVIGAEQALEGLSVALATSQMPDAIVGVPYSVNLNQLLTVTGDASYSGGGITWGVVSSSLPEGLYLTADGYIGGTPTAAGTGDIQVRASYKTAQGEQTYQVVSLPLTVALSGAVLPAATVGSPYSYDFKSLVSSNDSTFTGDKASFSASGLPSGLSLAADGTISGVPTVKNEAGASFQVLASYKAQTGQQAYTIVVNGAVLQVTQISAARNYTCAVTTSGGAKCWGNNESGQLGDGSATNRTTPVSVLGLTSGVTAIGTSKNTNGGNSYHTCAIQNGAVMCWGYNAYGQLGDGTAVSRRTPIAVTALGSVTSIAIGGDFSCARTVAGAAYCWGRNYLGRLGDGTQTNRSVPGVVSGLGAEVTSLVAGFYHACAVLSSGSVKCWGDNAFSQLGDGTTTNRMVPVDVVGIGSSVSQISGGFGHTCAVTTAGRVMCWGYNASGQMGNGSTSAYAATPVQATGLSSGAVSVFAGESFTCALMTSGNVKCWGANNIGQLGDGTTIQKLTPVNTSITGVKYLSAGGHHACAVPTSGSAKCWGYNAYGNLGDGSTALSRVPIDVAP